MRSKWLGCNSAEKNLSVMIDHKMNMSQCHAVANEGKRLARICKRHIAWKTCEAILLLCSALLKPQLGGCVKFWLLHSETGAIQSKRVQRRAAGLIRGLKNVTYKMIWKNWNYLAQRPENWQENIRVFRYKIGEGMIFSLSSWWMEQKGRSSRKKDYFRLQE